MTEVAAVAQGWAAFCDKLKQSGLDALERWHGAEDATAEQAAETLMYAQRYLRMGLDWETDNASPTHSRPVWLDRVSAGAGLYGPNLDNGYVFIRIDGRHNYRLEIDTDCLMDINVAVHTERPVGGGAPSIGNWNLKDLTVRDGKASIYFGTEPCGDPWFEIPREAQIIFIRTYYTDWSRHHNPGLRIECLTAPEAAPAYRSPEAVVAGLSQAVTFMENSLVNGRKFLEFFFKDVPPNTVRPPAGHQGSPEIIQYGGVHWQLASDEALLFECDVPDAPYWSVQWQKWPWATPLDPLRHVISLNNEQAHVDADGRMRIVLARDNPDTPNWLETGPRDEGFLMFRWIWSSDNPLPTVRVVKTAQVRDLLPTDTPHHGAEEHAAMLQARREHLSLRY